MFTHHLLIANTVSLGVLIVYSTYFFLKLSRYKSSTSIFKKPISIIICAKNEFQNLKEKLPIIFKQDYLDYEVIIVNDQSLDDTAVLLKEFEKKYNNLVVVTIEKHINKRQGKKLALTLGIKTAKHEHLLLTDADCISNSNRWITKMCRGFNSTDIILGYGGYEKKKGLLNKLIRFDTFNVAQQFLSYALAGQAYMGVGRNMAYKKTLFFENKGFANHLHIASGDDDLFIQEIANKNNVSIEINEDAHTTSVAIRNWGEWIYQKRRHITTAPLYKKRFKVLLSIYPLAQILFWTALSLLFIYEENLQLSFILLAIKLLLSYLVNYKPMRDLKVLDLYWIHPVYEIVYLYIQGFFVLLNIINKPKKWSK